MTVQQIQRSIEVDLEPDELWQLVADNDELATWLGDEVDIDLVPGGSGRVLDDDVERDVRVESVVEGERISWQWWPHADPRAVSRVELVIAPRPGGSRLDIAETLIAPVAVPALRWDVRTTLMSIGCAATCRA